MASFDILSEINKTEVRNAVDQVSREVATRYDFKGTDSVVEYKEKEMLLVLETASEERMKAMQQVLEEKLVKRKVSLKCLEFGSLENASGGRSRLKVSLKSGINKEMAKKINVSIKAMKVKGIQSSTQGDQVRVTGKKRDALQQVIATLKEETYDLPLQFDNFRD